jgi:predicted SnoaL-like aldol condensation-catalyzing enzyme
MSTEENKAIVRRWSEELFNQGHLEVADEIVAPTYRRHDPGDPFVVESPEDLKRLVSMLRAQVPDLHISVEDVIAEGDKVVTRYTGANGTLSGIQIFHLMDGKIVESWANRDDLGALRLRGVITFNSFSGASEVEIPYQFRQIDS